MLKVFSIILPGLFISLFASAQNKIHVEEASKHVGEVVTICDKIYEGEFLEKSKEQPTFLKIGGVFPKPQLTIFINHKDRKNFSDKPETFYVEKDVCITGKIVKLKGKPHIMISKPTDIQIGTE